FLKWYLGNSAPKRDRLRASFSTIGWPIRILPVAAVLCLHRISQGDLLANGLRLSKVRHSRTRRERSGRETFCDQRDRNHYPGADPRSSAAKVWGGWDGSDRRSDLRRGSIHHGTANRMVCVGCQRCVRPMAGARLPWSEGKYSPLLRDVRAVSDRLFSRR